MGENAEPQKESRSNEAGSDGSQRLHEKIEEISTVLEGPARVSRRVTVFM